MLMPDGCGFYLDDISIPVSWYTIGKDINDRLYFRINGNEGANIGFETVGFAVVPEGNYSLVTLNGAIVDELNKHMVDFFVSDPNLKTDTIGIKTDEPISFEILTDAQLDSAGFSSTNSRSINKVLRNFTPKVNSNNSPYVSGYVDLVPIRNIYITSSGLGNFNTMSISGERAIVKKVPVTAGYGEMIHDQSVIGIDYLDCSKQTLSRLGFQLKDVFGNTINLHGQHWSFSIVFSRISEIM